MLETMWTFMNSYFGLLIISALGLIAWNWFKTKAPAVSQWEGDIIAGIKFAEKQIPDEVPNKAVKRLDEALKYVLRAYEVSKGSASAEIINQFKQAIQVKHAELETKGNI